MIQQLDRKNSTNIVPFSVANAVLIDPQGVKLDASAGMFARNVIKEQYSLGAGTTALRSTGVFDFFDVETKPTKDELHGLFQRSAQTAWIMFFSSSSEASTEIVQDESNPEVKVSPEAGEFITENRLKKSIETLAGIVATTIPKGALESLVVRYEESEDYDLSIRRILCVDIKIHATVDTVGAWDDVIQRKIVNTIQSTHHELFSLNYLFS